MSWIILFVNSRHNLQKRLCYNASMTLSVEKYPELQALLASGQEIALEQNGEVVARVTPIQRRTGLPIPGLLSGKIWIAPDFDKTPNEILELFESGEASGSSRILV
jgi:antitoxin (DNA-binding transcriptional repressor) of toxin-antitoxin stability system